MQVSSVDLGWKYLRRDREVMHPAPSMTGMILQVDHPDIVRLELDQPDAHATSCIRGCAMVATVLLGTSRTIVKGDNFIKFATWINISPHQPGPRYLENPPFGADEI